jgi:phospholipid-translocating ATPase
MFGAVIIFEENIFLKIITVTFTVLIFAELLNVYLEIKKFNKEISIILFATCVTYLASLILFKSILDIYFIFDIKTFSRILLLAFLCWFPLYTFDKVKRMLWPSEINKLEMKELNKSKVTL